MENAFLLGHVESHDTSTEGNTNKTTEVSSPVDIVNRRAILAVGGDAIASNETGHSEQEQARNDVSLSFPQRVSLFVIRFSHSHTLLSDAMMNIVERCHIK
jgi:hypothetical protein